jgi:sigma-B regulation protein RsbU (phosphoserine phosphatase)
MQESPLHRRSVLVVDDEPGMRYMARRVFEHRFDVMDAGSGEEALELLEHHEFNFAVVDVSLPGLSGLKLLTRIKEHRPDIDVVVMTGSASDPDEALEDAIRRKAFFFLRKPVPMTVLETLADRIVENQVLSEQLDDQLKTLQKDLEAARIFQKRLLPPENWTGHRIEVGSRYVASDRLSGDFLDCWTLPDGGTALLIADVMGHGPSAAMATGMIKSQVQRLTENLEAPGAVLSALEDDFSRHQIRGFLTTFLIFDRPDRGVLQYAGAGHPSARLRVGSDGDVVQLHSDGLPLNTVYGVVTRQSTEIERVPGSRILLHTDGYSEATGRGGQLFDEPRLDGGSTNETPFRLAVGRALNAPDLALSIESLESDLAEFESRGEEDDRAVLIAELH